MLDAVMRLSAGFAAPAAGAAKGRLEVLEPWAPEKAEEGGDGRSGTCGCLRWGYSWGRFLKRICY